MGKLAFHWELRVSRADGQHVLHGPAAELKRLFHMVTGDQRTQRAELDHWAGERYLTWAGNPGTGG